MENRERIQSLTCLFDNVSKKLSGELLKHLPDVSTLKDCRKQLSQLDKDIRRIQMRKDFE